MTVTTLLDIEKIPFEEYTDDNKEEYIASIAVSLKRTADYLESMNNSLALFVAFQAPGHTDLMVTPDAIDESIKKKQP